jgi:hypothetical protein
MKLVFAATVVAIAACMPASASPLMPLPAGIAAQHDEIVLIKNKGARAHGWGHARPHGWNKGRKVGWMGRSMPPGQYKKRRW